MRFVVGERGKGRDNPGTVLRDVAAVETQALVADFNGRMGVHCLKRQLRPVRVLAQLRVEIIEDRQDQACGSRYAASSRAEAIRWL